jgi:hypothetical protein
MVSVELPGEGLDPVSGRRIRAGSTQTISSGEGL